MEEHGKPQQDSKSRFSFSSIVSMVNEYRGGSSNNSSKEDEDHKSNSASNTPSNTSQHRATVSSANAAPASASTPSTTTPTPTSPSPAPVLITSGGSINSTTGALVVTSTIPPVDKPETHFQLLDMEKVFEDSPMFKAEVKAVEEDMEEFSGKLKKLVKTTNQISSLSKNMRQLYNQLADEFTDFGASMEDEEIKKGFDKFGNAMRELQGFQEVLMVQLETLISQPMENFAKEDIEGVREDRRRFDKTGSSYESALSKYAQQKKQANNSQSLEQELLETRQDYQNKSLDFVFSLNDIHAKKKFEFFERAAAFTYANLTYFHQGHELFNEMGPYMTKVSQYIQQMRKSYDDERERVDRYKQYLQKLTPVNPRPPQSKVTAKTIRGYLFKKNSGVTGGWRKRYFVIEDGHLRYYKTGKDLQPVTAINLLLCTVKIKQEERRFCFEIISPDKSYVLQAESEEKMTEWMAVIQNATADLLNIHTDLSKRHVDSPKPESHLTPTSPAASAASSLVSSTSSAGSPQKSSLVHNSIPPLDQIRAVNEANRVCADCGARDPEWASINLGILVCIECSGIHRSMGVHISKVRSFTLDKWEPELLKLMISLGNSNVNSVYEASIPDDIKKPDENTPRAAREKYIRMKYQDRKFVEKSTRPQLELNNGLYEASKHNQPATQLQFLALGADINYSNQDQAQKTPIHAAAIEGSLLSALFLIQNRADLNKTDGQVWTPLHYAAYHGRVNMCVALFKGGAQLAIKDATQRTPLDIAVAGQKADCVTFFRLAQLALEEGNGKSPDESFMEALLNFSHDAQNSQTV